MLNKLSKNRDVNGDNDGNIKKSRVKSESQSTLFSMFLDNYRKLEEKLASSDSLIYLKRMYYEAVSRSEMLMTKFNLFLLRNAGRVWTYVQTSTPTFGKFVTQAVNSFILTFKGTFISVIFRKYTKWIFDVRHNGYWVIMGPMDLIFRIIKSLLVGIIAMVLTLHKEYGSFSDAQYDAYAEGMALSIENLVKTQAFTWLIVSVYAWITIALVGSILYYTGNIDVFMWILKNHVPDPVAYEIKHCNIDIWRSCLNNNVFPGIKSDEIGQVLNECLQICSSSDEMLRATAERSYPNR
jgi:hypothetical protein